MKTLFLRNRFGRKSEEGPGQGRGSGGGRRGKGGGNKAGSGPGGDCVCPTCGKKLPHGAGQRCKDMICPDCGIAMTRE